MKPIFMMLMLAVTAGLCVGASAVLAQNAGYSGQLHAYYRAVPLHGASQEEVMRGAMLGTTIPMFSYTFTAMAFVLRLILVKYRLKSMLVRLFCVVFWFSGAVQAGFAACRLSLQKNSPLRDIGVEPVPVLTRSWYVTRQIGPLQDPRLRPRPSSFSADFPIVRGLLPLQ
jgi:hypothetical protein